MKELEHISEIFKNYDTFVIDLWGVMHDGIKLNSKAIEAVDHLKNNQKKLYFYLTLPDQVQKLLIFY